MHAPPAPAPPVCSARPLQPHFRNNEEVALHEPAVVAVPGGLPSAEHADGTIGRRRFLQRHEPDTVRIWRIGEAALRGGPEGLAESAQVGEGSAHGLRAQRQLGRSRRGWRSSHFALAAVGAGVFRANEAQHGDQERHTGLTHSGSPQPRVVRDDPAAAPPGPHLCGAGWLGLDLWECRPPRRHGSFGYSFTISTKGEEIPWLRARQ